MKISVGAMKQIPKPWKFSGWNHENSVGAVESPVGARSTFYSTMYPIQCNNDYYSEPSGWVKRSYVRIAMAFVLALCLSSTEGKSDAPTHLLFGSSFIFCFICYYGSVSYFLFWSNWIGFMYSIMIKPKGSYFEVQTKQLFWFVRLLKWTKCHLYLYLL